MGGQKLNGPAGRNGLSIAPHLVLLLQDLVGMGLVVRDVDALQAVDVLGQAGLGDVCLAGLDGLHEGVVDEDVLLLGLNEPVALRSDGRNQSLKK